MKVRFDYVKFIVLKGSTILEAEDEELAKLEFQRTLDEDSSSLDLDLDEEWIEVHGTQPLED